MVQDTNQNIYLFARLAMFYRFQSVSQTHLVKFILNYFIIFDDNFDDMFIIFYYIFVIMQGIVSFILFFDCSLIACGNTTDFFCVLIDLMSHSFVELTY